MTALFARAFARVTHGENQAEPDSAYLCGLLHNIGVVVLTHVAPVQMTEVFRLREVRGQSLLKVERQQLGLSHDTAGAMLAQSWQLPVEVKAVIEHHRQWSYQRESWPASALVGFSKWVAEDVLAEDDNFLAAPIPHGLGLEESAVEQVTEYCSNNIADVVELAKIFSQVS